MGVFGRGVGVVEVVREVFKGFGIVVIYYLGWKCLKILIDMVVRRL